MTLEKDCRWAVSREAVYYRHPDPVGGKCQKWISPAPATATIWMSDNAKSSDIRLSKLYPALVYCPRTSTHHAAVAEGRPKFLSRTSLHMYFTPVVLKITVLILRSWNEIKMIRANV